MSHDTLVYDRRICRPSDPEEAPSIVNSLPSTITKPRGLIPIIKQIPSNIYSSYLVSWTSG